MHTSLRHYSITVEREAHDHRGARLHELDGNDAIGTRRRTGPSLRERIHDALRGAGRPAPTAGALA